MNSVQVMGNLARDPVVRATKTGRAMASFTVAVNRSFTTPQGEQREITDWINVVAWGNLAEAVGNQLKKAAAFSWKAVLLLVPTIHQTDREDGSAR